MDGDVREQVRARYAEFARQAGNRSGSGCGCGTGGCGCGSSDSANVIIDRNYSATETAGLDQAAETSLGCGNPLAGVDVAPGAVVLDLGSGGGLDAMLAARRAGSTGKVYGLDMTDEMLTLARRNVARAGLSNIEFIKGHIEDIPLPDASVDLIISNCVINLSPDKDRVLREAYRVLRPGGRFAVSDTVFDGDVTLIPPELRVRMDAWAGCITGSLEKDEYLAKLRAAGFADASVTITRRYDGTIIDAGVVWPDGVSLASAFIQATK